MQAAHLSKVLGVVVALRHGPVGDVLDIAGAFGEHAGLLCAEGSFGVLHFYPVYYETVAETAFLEPFAHSLPHAAGGFPENNGFVPGEVSGNLHLTGFGSVNLKKDFARERKANALVMWCLCKVPCVT